MSTTYKRGFTLIELLVVIAIIGILSAVVLASLGAARTKGNDAAIKSSLINARAQAELFYDSNGGRFVGTVGSADDICSATSLAGGVKGIYQFAQSAAAAGGNTVNVAIATPGSATTATCHATPVSGSYNPLNAWAIEAPLDGVYPGITKPAFCVQSDGFAKVIDINAGSKLANGDARCDS
jgi:prepilin-type N-terminal cleavage/methylation domain-containing protein